MLHVQTEDNMSVTLQTEDNDGTAQIEVNLSDTV